MQGQDPMPKTIPIISKLINLSLKIIKQKFLLEGKSTTKMIIIISISFFRLKIEKIINHFKMHPKTIY